MAAVKKPKKGKFQMMLPSVRINASNKKIIVNEDGYCTFRSSAKYEKKTTANGSTGLEKIQRDLS